jgi:hypothetical protein
LLIPLNAVQVIGTHSGTFHCDEALAVFLLRQTSTYKDACESSSPPAVFNPSKSLGKKNQHKALRRTRETNLLSTCDVVVDVGAVYDPAKQLFDHHQRGFDEVFGGEFKTKLSSAGLIYKYVCVFLLQRWSLSLKYAPKKKKKKKRHFGQEVISRRLNLEMSDPNLQTLYLKLYRVRFFSPFFIPRMLREAHITGLHRTARWRRQRHPPLSFRREAAIPERRN